MDLTKIELLGAAEYFGISEVKSTNSKPTIAAALADNGVTIEQYNKFFKRQEQEDFEGEPLPERTEKMVDMDSAVLIRMDRRNPTFQLRGYLFSSAHPFHLVSAEDADWILENERGFRVATPKEAKEYYG